MIITDLNILRKKSSDICTAEEELEIIKKLEDALKQVDNAIGLSAVQIGIHKRVAIVRINDIKINLINSVVFSECGETSIKEGCLSLPNAEVEVKRKSDVLIKNNGFLYNEKFALYGLPSICAQHEMDHWDGVLMIDKAITRHTRIGPNMLCPCGSKKKYKKCCGKLGDKNGR